MADKYVYETFGGKRMRKKTDAAGNALPGSNWEADDTGSSKSTDTLGREMMGGKKVTDPAGMADLSDAEIEKMPDGLGKDLARRKAKAQREAKSSVVAKAGS